jgi:hypothetical protein
MKMDYREALNDGDILDNAPDYAKATASLLQWSTNYDWQAPDNPLPIFLSLIGYFEDVYGENQTRKTLRLDYISMGQVGEALTEYANRPEDVFNYIKFYIESSWEK